MTEPELQAGGGVPDAFQRLWTPHRMAYIRGEGKPTGENDCPFCRAPKLPDAEALIIARGTLVYALLNLYPYNSGHLLVAPYAHTGDFAALDPRTAADPTRLSQTSVAALEQVYHPHAFNLGMNLGREAGAGLLDHLHVHIVPRWNGDTNFMPVLADTRVMPQTPMQTYEMLKGTFGD